MSQYPKMQYQVQEAIYDAKSMLDEQNFYNQRQGSPAELTRKITYILGDYNKNYPISLMTMGGIGFGPGEGNVLKRAAVEIDDVEFTYPVMGRDTKASVCMGSPYSGTDEPGLGNTPFYIYFNDNWIKRFYIIQSAHGIQAYVLQDPEPFGDYGFRYLVQLDPADPGESCPLSELETGVLWIDLNAHVAESESRTTESKMAMPGLYKNQMGFIRAGMSWAGNAANKVMKLKVQTDKGETDVWMDYFMWQFEKRWLEECEHSYWYSRYNRQANGEIALKDLYSGKAIPRGSGLLEQIGNKSTYSELTYDILANRIGDALFGQSDTANQSITLYTGRGGMRAIDRAMKKEGIKFLQDWGFVADKFVTGTGRNLMLGGFFDGFYHVDGYTIKVKHNPIFDLGRVAMASDLHPESGLPLESYRMVAIDDNDYDGQPNIQHVAQKGRSFLHGIIPGLTPMPRSLKIMGNYNVSSDEASAANIIMTDEDKSGYTRFKSAGIQILRANKCFDMQCVAGLGQ